MILEILTEEKARAYVEGNRAQTIAELTERRIRNVMTLAESKDRRQVISAEDEVSENTAASYGSI